MVCKCFVDEIIRIKQINQYHIAANIMTKHFSINQGRSPSRRLIMIYLFITVNPRLSARALIKFLKKISPKLPKIGPKNLIFSRNNRVQWIILHRINCDTHAFILDPFIPPYIGYFKKLVLWGALIRGFTVYIYIYIYISYLF